MITAVSPYLQSNFAPVHQEVTLDELVVIGELPSDLSGMYVRNGPNPRFAPIGLYQWFDGDGMLHGVQINNGKASYRNRYVRTQGFKLEENAGRAIWTGVMEAPRLNAPANNLFSPFKNTANTGLLWHSGQLMALWEGAEPYKIESSNLETVGPYNYHGKLSSPFTAHPKVDPETGELLFFGYTPLDAPYLHYSIVSAQGELLRTVPIPLPIGVMIHDFAITANYTIFLNLPLTFSLKRLHRTGAAYLFEGDFPSRFGILPRYGDNSNIRWFEAPSCYIFHTVNAYEVGEEIVLIACRMSGTKCVDLPTKFNDVQDDRPRLYYWRFNLRTGTVKEEALDEVASDFPSLNQQKLGHHNRYCYTARMASGHKPDFTFDALLKYDLTTGSCQVHKLGTGRYGGEAVFVPRPNSAAEDDGWLLTFVYDKAKNASELIVVDAQDLTAEPLARVLIPQRVPYGFHGIWIPEQLMNININS